MSDARASRLITAIYTWWLCIDEVSLLGFMASLSHSSWVVLIVLSTMLCRVRLRGSLSCIVGLARSRFALLFLTCLTFYLRWLCTSSTGYAKAMPSIEFLFNQYLSAQPTWRIILAYRFKFQYAFLPRSRWRNNPHLWRLKGIVCGTLRIISPCNFGIHRFHLPACSCYAPLSDPAKRKLYYLWLCAMVFSDLESDFCATGFVLHISNNKLALGCDIVLGPILANCVVQVGERRQRFYACPAAGCVPIFGTSAEVIKHGSAEEASGANTFSSHVTAAPPQNQQAIRVPQEACSTSSNPDDRL